MNDFFIYNSSEKTIYIFIISQHTVLVNKCGDKKIPADEKRQGKQRKRI